MQLAFSKKCVNDGSFFALCPHWPGAPQFVKIKVHQEMLSARRQSNGQIVTAYHERKENAPFICLECDMEVVLKMGRRKVNHFAHVNPLACEYANNESDAHRKCKMEIYEALLREPHVTSVALEHPLGTVRPDVSAHFNGVPVAIEIQISFLSIETIMARTIEYHRKGIYVLWLLLWTPKLDAKRYAPEIWEKWIHAAYFGRVYYWTGALSVISYHFDADLKTVPQTSWYSKDGKRMTAGGYSRRSARYRRAVRGKSLNLAKDFEPKERYWWEGDNLKVPDAKLLIHNVNSSADYRQPS
jgi:competence protein CoiA